MRAETRAVSNLSAVAALTAKVSRGTGMLDLQGPCHAHRRTRQLRSETRPAELKEGK